MTCATQVNNHAVRVCSVAYNHRHSLTK